MSRARYFAFRTLQTVFLLWFVLTFLFFLFKSLPGSFVDLMAVQGASEESLHALRRKWGLDQPIYVQYFRYMSNLAALDIGQSLQYRVPVWEYVRMRIFNTFILVAPATTFTYLVGSLIGAVLGSKRGSRVEQYGLVPVILSGSFPEFFVAIVLIIVFAGWVPVFPTSGMISPEVANQFIDAPWWRPYLTGSFLSHYVLPFSAVVIRYIYLPAMIMRTSVVDVMEQEYTYYHRVTGIPRRNRLQHAAKNASLPVLTMYPVSMARAISGLVMIEIVFNWPGIGFTLVESVLARDFPVMMFVFFLAAAFVIVANFVVDIAYGIIDPRVSVAE